MRILYYLPIFFLFTAFLCESDEPTEAIDPVIASLVAEPGEIVVEADGAVATLTTVNAMSYYESGCEVDGEEVDRIRIWHQQENADGTRLFLVLHVVKVELGTLNNTLDPGLSCIQYSNFNSRIRLGLWFAEADGSVTESYYSDAELDSESFLELTEFVLPECCDLPIFYGFAPDEDLFGYVSGNFKIMLYSSLTGEALRLRGVINLAPLIHAFETSPYL